MKLLCNLLAWILFFLDHVVTGVGSDEVSVSVMEGDSVVFHTGVETSKQEDIKWYFSSTRIAQISGDLSNICTDVQCNKGTERFRDRLKLDHQTGSLSIRDIRKTDSGRYELKIIGSSSGSEKTFNVTVKSAPPVVHEVKTNEGESVTLDSGQHKKPDDVMMWFFKDTLIAQITGDPSKTCTDVECNEGTERFRDRLQLDQTGSLTITDTRNTDSGLYQLQITSSVNTFSITRVKTLNVTVSGTGLSSPALAGFGIFVAILLLAAALAIYCCRRRYKRPPQHVNGVN